MEQTRRKLCTHLGQTGKSQSARVVHSKWTHDPPPPPPSPTLPHGSLWSLINHIKVLHQYTSLLSEAASGQGVHSAFLKGGVEMCQGPLAWFAPLCMPVSSEANETYQRHLDTWREANPGLYSHSEAAYHVHQGYLVADRHMTRFLVSTLSADAKEYEVDIAGNILAARPNSFDEFHSHFSNWRRAGLYHTLCLAAKNLPRAEQWVPRGLLHESSDWQELLDEFNQSSFCTKERMAGICEALADRSPLFCNHVCSLLDKVAILTRVKSNFVPNNPNSDHSINNLNNLNNLDDCLSNLQVSPHNYTHCLDTWGKLRQTIEDNVPPSLMCPSLNPRGGWGYRKLELVMEGKLRIKTGPLEWIAKDKEPTEKLPDRLYDILTRMGEAATSPEVAHLMLSPATMTECLEGRTVDVPSLKHFADRNYVIGNMQNNDTHFISSLNKLIQCLPVVELRTFPAQKQFLAWRIDLPPRALLYHGEATEVDLSVTPPYLLNKSSMQDKLQCRTLSGISILDSNLESKLDSTYSDTDALHSALRACIAEEVIDPHADFADHPLHKVSIRVGPGKTEIHHTTTLAEAVNLFTGPPPFRTSDVMLHQSEPWNEEHIDDRYAERQTASNGVRFRDWATVYHDEHEIQRCRMASHAITCGQVYETHFPLSTPTGNRWVSVASTVQAETRMLRHMGGNSSLEVLRRSVDGRFMHDAKLLPVRNKGDVVDRAHMELYTDSKSGQVLLAYAPVTLNGSKTVEFMSFRHQT